MSAQTYPRSPKALLGGIAHLGRFIDKIRLRHAGKIQEYNYITVGFDKYLVDFLQIDPKSFEQRVLAGGTDDELLAWVRANSRKPWRKKSRNGRRVFYPPVQKMMPHANGFRDGCKKWRRNVACRRVPFRLCRPGLM